MNIDELKHNLATLAEETQDHGAAQRLDGVDRKVSTHRRTTLVGAGAAAAVAVAAVVIAPSILSESHHSPEPTNHGRTSPLPTVSDHGVAFYSAPAGAKLIGRSAAAPGTREISFTFTPSTLNLSWEQECWDPGVAPLGHGAEYSSFVNGHPLGGSSCQGDPDPTPISSTGSFGYSPQSNGGGWKDLGVAVGEPSTLTLRITKHAERSVTPQLVGAVYERGRQVETDGVWYDQQIVYKGHTYRALDAKVGRLDGSRVVRVSVDLPRSDHPLYVFRGAQHVHGGLQLFGDSNGAFNLAKGVPGAGSGDVEPLDRQTASIRAHVKNLDARGDLYILVYERID